MSAGDIYQPGHFLWDGFALLNMVEMPWVIADLVHIGSDLLGHFVVFLQINRKCGCSLRTNFFERGSLFGVIYGDTNDASPSFLQLMDLGHSGVNVGSLGRTHTLYDHWRAATNLDFTNSYRPGGHSFHAGILLSVEFEPQPNRGSPRLQLS